jgi:nitrogen fixation protein FixH
MSDAPKKKSRWGMGVAALSAGFALFIIFLVVLASFQDFDLVEKDYYQRGQAYQTRIDDIARTKRLDASWQVTYDSDQDRVSLHLPLDFSPDEVSGTLWFYRPSNQSLDRQVAIALDSLGHQVIKTSELVAGVWRIKIDWMVLDIPYYTNESIFIQR